jgi:histidyl-tRNA synthetase
MPPDIYIWRHVEGVFSETFSKFAYEPMRTPIFESTDLFLRSVGEGTDIVSKEMYTFKDRGGRDLTLRPENTAAAMRAYLEAGMHRRGGVTRLCYIGPMFRYDRPQAGRYRQFHQVGAEAVGSLNPMLDVEIIDLVLSGLDALAFEGLSVKLNSVGCRVCRGPYTDVLKEALAARSDKLCDDCGERAATNPLRVFDCKRCDELKRELPAIAEHLCEECGDHFAAVKGLLGAAGRRFDEDAQLVRGLDYYTKTTFEILHGSLGAQNALCGGGRYDDLVEQCGGPPTPAVGFSAGIERIIGVLPDAAAVMTASKPATDFYIAVSDEAAAPRALKAATVLRRLGRVCVDASMRALKKQLKGAEQAAARYTVIVDSSDTERLKWKDMNARTQTDVSDVELEVTARKGLE